MAEDRSWRCIGGYHLRSAGRGQGLFPGRECHFPAFFLGRFAGSFSRVKTVLIAAFLALGATCVRAQEAVLEPIVVTGTFELRPGPSIVDRFTEHLLKQTETKRTLEEAVARAPWFNAQFWKYLPPLQSSSVDSYHFFTPNYLSSEYRNTARALEESRKQSLFNDR